MNLILQIRIGITRQRLTNFFIFQYDYLLKNPSSLEPDGYINISRQVSVKGSDY
jgi:hypothetical protein